MLLALLAAEDTYGAAGKMAARDAGDVPRPCCELRHKKRSAGASGMISQVLQAVTAPVDVAALYAGRWTRKLRI